jgi:hypothetical protein
MPSRMYLLVRGKPGLPVGNPWAPMSIPPRFAGWKIREKLADDPDHVLEHYEPCDEVLQDEASLRKAIFKGDLILLREAMAKNQDAAIAKLIPPNKPAAPAPRRTGGDS